MNEHNAWGRLTKGYYEANLRLEKALQDNPNITDQCIEFEVHRPDAFDARYYVQYRPMWFDPQKHEKELRAKAVQPPPVVTTFFNVIISVEQPTPKDAYQLLCVLLGHHKVEYATDTYRVEDQGDKKPTTELMFK